MSVSVGICGFARQNGDQCSVYFYIFLFRPRLCANGQREPLPTGGMKREMCELRNILPGITVKVCLTKVSLFYCCKTHLMPCTKGNYGPSHWGKNTTSLSTTQGGRI